MPSAQNPPAPFARPVFSSLQGNSSAYQSFQSSTSSLASPSPASAPLPSPSSQQQQHHDFFSSMNPQQPQQQQQQQQQAQPQQQQHFASPSQYAYQPNRQGAGQTAAETNNFLGQAALLAEAAKRAQMAVVMRDIEEMEL